MSPKAFLILAVVALVSVVGAGLAVSLQPQYQSSREVGNKVFPNLMDRVDSVARIEIIHPEKTLNVRRQGSEWVLAEADDYPAQSKTVNKALLNLAQLELYDPKTATPELFEKLWVDDPHRKGGQAKQVTLFDADGKVIQQVVVGRTKFAVEGSTGGGVYLRRPNENQSWLAKGDLDIAYEPRDWFDRAFMEVDSKRFKRISIRHPDGGEIRIVKADPKAEHFGIENLPQGRKLKSESEADDYALVFSGFRVDDVVAAAKKPFPPGQTLEANFETFDGLTVKARLYVEDKVHWMTFEAATAPGATPAEAGKVDPVKDAETINANAKGWVYDISDYRTSALKKRLQDMLEPKAGS